MTLPNYTLENLTRQYQQDLADIMASGRVPTWIEMDSVLQKDEYRVLKAIADEAGYVEAGTVITEHGEDDTGLFSVVLSREVQRLTADAGFVSDGNALAVINKCLSEGWIARRWSSADNAPRLDLTDKGRWYIDMYETNEYWEEDRE